MARKDIKISTVKILFAKSGNQCAFPECNLPLIGPLGHIWGEVCHIEAAEPLGPRFNKNQSDEDRRKPENLILLCRHHHVVTDESNVYTVSKLKKMKIDHQHQFEGNPYVIDQKTANKIKQQTIKLWKHIEDIQRFNIEEGTGTAADFITPNADVEAIIDDLILDFDAFIECLNPFFPLNAELLSTLLNRINTMHFLTDDNKKGLSIVASETLTLFYWENQNIAFNNFPPIMMLKLKLIQLLVAESRLLNLKPTSHYSSPALKRIKKLKRDLLPLIKKRLVD